MKIPLQKKLFQRKRHPLRLGWLLLIFVVLLSITTATPAAAVHEVTIISPDNGEILDGVVTLQANVSGAVSIASVEFFYDPHEDDEPEFSLGLATLNPSTGFWELVWDTTTVLDTFNDIDTNGDGSEDTTVNLTKPPTHDGLRVVATADSHVAEAAIDIRVQNMLTVRFTLPDNQEDIRGFEDLEVILTSQYEITGVRFDVYNIADADPAILIPFGEFESLGEPIENRHYGRPLGNPTFPTGSPVYPIGAAVPEGSRRWVFRGWDTTTVPDGAWLLVATATDAGDPDALGTPIPPRTATYMVETYIVNDLRVKITAPDDGASVSRFVALEARTSSLTGADNAAPGSLWPATGVEFTIDNGSDPVVNISGTEIPSGSGRWRAVWDGDASAPGAYTITATATNANPNGAEVAIDSINVNLVAPGADLEAFFPFDWSNCNLFECSFLDGSSGGPNWWFWEFGDGNTSTDQLPTHTYANYGVYTVSLTVSNDGGTTTDTYSRVIPVGNTGVVSFNRNALDDGATEFIDWTSAFKNFTYEVGSTLAIPVMWKTTTGSAQFNSLPTTVCDDDEDTSNQECIIFTPEEALGTAPTVVGAAEDGVLFTLEFTQVQFRGVTDIFKGKANIRVVVDVDLDGNGSVDQQNQLGTNVDVTNSGVVEDEARLVKIISPFEGEFVGGAIPVTAGIVSSLAADQVEFFLNGTTSLGVDTDGSNGWATSWNTTTVADGPHQLTAVATFAGTETTTSDVRNVTVENTLPNEPPAPAGTFQTGRANDTTGQYISFPFEIEERGGGPPVAAEPAIDASMTAVIVPSSIVVYPGGDPNGGLIGGDAIEFDVVISNTSTDPGAVLTAYAFQSKFSESPALASRIGDKAFYGVMLPAAHPAGPLVSVKKNGTSNGLFSGRWKGICINSSTDFIPEFNAGLDNESLECAGNRADSNFDGLPELQFPIKGLYPGDSQTVRVRIEAGTTDGALHVVAPGTLKGEVVGTPVTGPNGITYFDIGVVAPTPTNGYNVLAIPDWNDNKVLANADGTFNPTFAPLADNLMFDNQIYLTLPRPNFALTDILGRNHTCETYGLDHINGIPCSGAPSASPVFGFLDTGDLLPGVQNFAAILHGFGEYAIDADGNPILDVNGDYTAPNYPYDTLCVNPATPDGLRCGARPFTPIAEFYKDNGNGTLTQQMVAGSYGELGSADQYTAFIATATAADWKEEVIPDPDPGGPCDPLEDPAAKKPACAQLRTSATAHFYDLDVSLGTGINGGDVVQFTMDIANTSTNPEAYLTAFNFQTKERNLADIGGLDGFSQDRRDIRVDSTLPLCTGLDDGACWNASLGIGQFPNVLGNGLLFGQMVWQSGRIDRAGQEVIPDFVAVDPVNGIDPVLYKLESVKKNGPFSPILKGNTNFICVKSGLFFPDQDADASCIGVPAILIDPNGEPVPGNISQRLGLAPGESQSVRIRMEYGDFRGALLNILPGTLTDANVRSDYTATRGLARHFDCEDQRELEYCHPDLVGDPIVYLPNSTATWLGPTTLEEIEWVIINQPGDAPRIMNFEQNFGFIMAMAGFIPTAEFHAPDPNPELVGTPFEGVLIRQQVLGEYGMKDIPDPELLAAIFEVVSCDDQTLTCNFDATASTGPIANYIWNFDDGTGDYPNSPAQVSYTYAEPGNYTVTLIVEDANGTPSAPAKKLVTVGEVAPQITSTPVTEATIGQLYSYQVEATGNPAPAFSLDAGPSGMAIYTASGLIEWTPDTAGVYDVTVRAANGVDPDATQSFQVMVGEAQAAPQITSTPVTESTAGQPYSYQVEATGNPAPTFSLDDPAPAGMTIGSASGLIEWTPDAAGTYDVTVTATNGVSPDATQSFQVTVSETQTAPEITSTPVTESTAGQPYSYQVTATGNPAPTFSLDVAPVGMTIDSISGLIEWTPVAGTHDVTVRATNGVSPDATQSFQIVVEEDTPPPSLYQLVFSTNQDRSNPAGLDGVTVSGKIYVFVAPDNDIRRAIFWLDGEKKRTDSSAPFDFVGGNQRRARPFDTDKIEAGSHTIKVELVLQDRSRVEINATFTVGSAPPPNQPPVASFTVTCTDLDCDFTNTSTDSDGSIASSAWDFGDSNSSSEANPSHSYGAAGTYQATLTVTDDDGATHSVSHEVTVEAPNQPPTADFTVSCADLACDFTNTSTDGDGSIDSSAWDFGDDNSSSEANPSHSYGAAGTYQVTLTVTDDDGATHSVSQDVTVTGEPAPPPPAIEYQLVYSTQKDRSNPAALDGASVEGRVYVFVTPDTNIKEVTFWLDGRRIRTEEHAPFDLMGGSDSAANPFNTKRLKKGEHQVKAEIVLEDESKVEVYATFTVTK